MKATGFSIYRATFPVIVLGGSIRRPACSSSISCTFRIPTAAGDPAQPDQGQAAADLLAGRSQMDFWRIKPNLLLPGVRSRRRPLRRNLRLRVRSRNFSTDAAHPCHRRPLGAEPEEVGFRRRLGANVEWRVYPGIPHLRCLYLRGAAAKTPATSRKKCASRRRWTTRNFVTTFATCSKAASTPFA